MSRGVRSLYCIMKMPDKQRQYQEFESSVDLNSIHKKISNKVYWSGNAWMEMIAVDLFRGDHIYQSDHTYCIQNEIPDKSDEKSIGKNVFPYMSGNADFMELDVQNFVEIAGDQEMQNSCSTECNDILIMEEEKSSTECSNVPIIEEQSNSTNGSDVVPIMVEQNSSTDCRGVPIINDQNSSTGCIDVSITNDQTSTTGCSELRKMEEAETSDTKEEIPGLCNSPSCSSLLSLVERRSDTFCSYTTDDSGIESCVFTESEDSLVEGSSTVVTTLETSIEPIEEDQRYIPRRRDSTDMPVKTYRNKRKASVDDEAVRVNERSVAMEVDEEVEDGEVPAKKCCAQRRNSREVLVSDDSPIIEGEFEMERRVTRLLVKTGGDKPPPVKRIDNEPGKLVWGYFRNGWWPAIIIKAEDAGMISTTGKIWVSWIGESRISELREKYVDSFSNNLEMRLNSLTTDVKTKVTCKKQKDTACFRTIQLLKKHFDGGALIRPYISWIKYNIVPHKEKLDELLFYPYPESLSNKLNDLKKVNFEKNEKYLRQQEKERLSKASEVKISTSSRKAEKLEKPVEDGGINIMDQKPGMIVWAKMQGYSLWPCVIMNYQHLNRKQPNVAHQWVMWYGDYKYSQVEYRQILNFPVGMEKMESKIRAMKDDLFSKAVLRAVKDYCEQLGYLTEPWKLEDVIDLFYKSKDRWKLKAGELNEPNDEDLYSQTIKKQLRKQINNQPVSEERKQQILKCDNMKSVLSGKSSIESLCITCFQSDEELEEHPFFYASMCNQCLEEFMPKVFAYGNDGKCFYCTLCGGEDLVAMCDNMNCPRVFCTACIKYIVCPESYEEILLKHPWYCFLCDSSSIQTEDSVVKIRNDWRNRLISIYRINCDDKTPSNFERFDRNKKIRVLSLFDGIGTGLVVLNKLNINVECYYASEIDPDSMQVSFFNHGHEVIQLGDVRNIDEKKIKEIAPIDLLIGGSPCNELSLANPKRRGLDDPEGSGILFYDYCRIKKLVKKYNRKRHLFWLFENVASMPKKFRSQISKNLGREPKFLDSADFSAQHRPRLYWGNLPWGPYQVNDVILQDALRKRCNRQALVKKIMTVTTRMNSLNQTKENLRPVLMDGKKDMLWVTELEEIFGFPMHYTDANLQKTRRLQLIGKAWSVQTLTAILRPLFFF